jgi:hypothetical protein
VGPEGLGEFKKSTLSGLEPATFRLAAQCLNHYATEILNIKILKSTGGQLMFLI